MFFWASIFLAYVEPFFFAFMPENSPEETRLETCFGETGLKIRPDVFHHNNYEQII